VRDVEPARLHVVRPDRSMTLEEFARAYRSSVPVEKLALLNRIEPGARLEAGAPYKIVTGGP